MAPFLSDDTVRDRDLAFVDAFARGREPPFPVRIARPRALRRPLGAPRPGQPPGPGRRSPTSWARSTTSPGTTVPGIGAAVGFDDEAGRRPPTSSSTASPSTGSSPPSVGPGGRLRWLWTRFATRLESLPPAWSAYVLSLTETVGTSMLALPIAVAGIGPLAGVVVLVVLGLVNIVTAAAMGEAVAPQRVGALRRGLHRQDGARLPGRAGVGGAHRGPVRLQLPDHGGRPGRHRLDLGRGHRPAPRAVRRSCSSPSPSS